MRVTYNFTPLIFMQSLLQYNDRTERWSTNLRFNWQRTAATEARASGAIGGAGMMPRGRL